MGYEVMGNGETVREFDRVLRGQGRRGKDRGELTGHLMYMCMGEKTKSKRNGV